MKTIIQFTVIILIGSLIILGTTFLANQIKQPDVKVTEKIVTTEKLIKAPECTGGWAEYKSLIDKGQYITLLKEKNTYASNGQFINSVSVDVGRIGDSKVACGYLFAEARINGKELDKNFDSVYINPNEFGGHILRSKSLNIEDPEKNKTEFLLPLDSISYLPRMPYNPNAQNYEIANWVNLLNTGSRVTFRIGLSALDSRGYIDEITIAYKCWDPETGKETQNCQLSSK